jgi:hypothetical protein
MIDWVDEYIDNYYMDNDTHVANRAFDTTDGVGIGDGIIRKCLKEVIRTAAKKEKKLNCQNLEKLKIVVVNNFCFGEIDKWKSKTKSEPAYEYFIFIPNNYESQGAVLKCKLAHEIAHFLFELQGKEFTLIGEEEKECNAKAEDWGFSDGQG